jgi:hypothetical protein
VLWGHVRIGVLFLLRQPRLQREQVTFTLEEDDEQAGDLLGAGILAFDGGGMLSYGRTFPDFTDRLNNFFTGEVDSKPGK